jgi:hypothetical protein
VPEKLQTTREMLKHHVMAQMGWPKTCVELTDVHLEDAAMEAEIWLAAHMGQVRRIDVQLTSGTETYQLPSDCEMVVEVAMPQRYSGSLPMDMPIQGLEDYFYGSHFRFGVRNGGFNSSVYQTLQNVEMMTRTMSADVEHVWDPYERRLTVHPCKVSGTAVVWYLSDQLDYDRLTMQQKHLIRRYAVAQAMQILGRIRSKFDSIPTASGTTSMNGPDLIASAESELLGLDEKIKNLMPPAKFITG